MDIGNALPRLCLCQQLPAFLSKACILNYTLNWPWTHTLMVYNNPIFYNLHAPGQIFSQQIKSQWNSPAQQLSKLWQNTHLFKVKTTECSSDILQTAECFLLPFLWKSIRVKRSWQLGTHIQNNSFMVQETIRLPCLTPASQMTEFRDQVISPRV